MRFLFIAALLAMATAGTPALLPYCLNFSGLGGNNQSLSLYGWKCDKQQSPQKCVKLFFHDGGGDDDDDEEDEDMACLAYSSLNVCKALCDENASLWPKPKSIVMPRKKKLLAIDANKISFSINVLSAASSASSSSSSSSSSYSPTPPASASVWNMLEELQQYYLDSIRVQVSKKHQVSAAVAGAELVITLRVQQGQETLLGYDTLENYTLSITRNADSSHSKTKQQQLQVLIEGENYFAVRHGIETLSQLTVLDEVSNKLLLPASLLLNDAPAYKHRGILLDTSRNYYSLKTIKRTLDAMAQNKLNTFHWHLTDSHSFPFLSETYPQMAAYGSYSSAQVYTWNDIRKVVKYARIRGIKVIPEFDAPSHVGEGWQYFENASSSSSSSSSPSPSPVVLCFKAEPWREYCVEPPCGILNPVNDKVYQILGNLYAEFNQLFDSDVFHMGGDEVSFKCWNQTQSVLTWMRERLQEPTHTNFLQLWSYFQKRALQELDKSAAAAERKIILWTSSLTESENVTQYLDTKRYLIQVWTTGNDPHILHLLNKGYQLIFSNYDALYFDCGFGAWIGEGNNWCSPYIGWQKVYMNNLQHMTVASAESQHLSSQILGAEAALWSEQSDSNTLDTRLWPRGCALAERLWSNPDTGWKSAESRILTQRERMVSRGISADSIQPIWCHQNEGLCY